MNFKYTIIILGQLMLAASLHAMEFPEDFFGNYQKESPCNQIKTLGTDAPESAYRATIKNLSKNNLTTCDCIKYLLEQKKQKAFAKLEQQVPGATQKILERKKQLDNASVIDTITWGKTKNFSVTCDPSVPQELCTFITKEYKKNKTACDLRVFFSNKPDGRAHSGLKLHNNKMINIIRLSKERFPSLSTTAQRGVIVHEIAHLNHNHLHFDLAAALENLYRSEAYTLVQRSLEAEADRHPAACDCLETAKNHEAFTQQMEQNHWKNVIFHDQNNKVITKEEAQQAGNNFMKIVKNGEKKIDPIHPFILSRVAWATKIRRLREIEETLKNEKNNKS